MGIGPEKAAWRGCSKRRLEEAAKKSRGITKSRDDGEGLQPNRGNLKEHRRKKTSQKTVIERGGH